MKITHFAWLSIAAAVATIILKTGAYLITGSVGLLSDALESLVNLVAAITALSMLHIAQRPPDEDHAYGHTKAEYFSSTIEGILIMVAALSIGIAAINRLIHPKDIEQVFIGLPISLLASGINYVVARQLFRASKKFRSITLEADAHHLMTDVWTSLGVVIGVGIVFVTHFQFLDPVIALLVAFQIIRSGFSLVARSALGFMDTAISDEELEVIKKVLDIYCTEGISYHGLRSRQSASRRFVSFHILVPGSWTVRKGHNLLEKIEFDIHKRLDKVTVFTHLEPREDPRSMDDVGIDRS